MAIRFAYPIALAAISATLFLEQPGFGDAEADGANSNAKPRTAISGNPNQPRRHFRVRDGVQLDDQAASMMYNLIAAEMAAGYALADKNVAAPYLEWKRFNSGPYISSTHGKRYINNYGNALARDYGNFENAIVLPEGAILAKDSFTITKAGTPVPGPLFVMEKMAPGFNYVSGDWRYSMVLPDGSLFGTTNGEGSRRVEFCIACHLARETTDHLFFVPRKYRPAPK